MNILYINHYAGSPNYGMEFRPYHFGQEWIKTNHKVTILAASVSHVRAKQPKLDNGKKTTEVIDGLTYIWYPTPGYDGNGLGRVKNILAFQTQLYKDIKNIVKNIQPDAVIASSTYPLDIFVARKIAKQANAKLIYEVHDLWPLSPIELGGMSPKHPFIMLCQFSENYAYKHADAVVSMLPKVHEHMSTHGLDLTKLHIVPNGIVEEAWTHADTAEVRSDIKDLIYTLKQENKVIVGYTGSLGIPNAMNFLIEAAELVQNSHLHFVIVGSGLEKNNLQHMTETLKLKNVTFFDPIPKTQIPALLSYFDIAYIGWHNTPIYRFGIAPNKLMDYMMAERVILHSVKAGNDPVKEAGCGLTVAPESPQDIANGLLSLAELPLESRTIMGTRGKQFILENHTYTVLANNFLKAMQ